MTGLTDVDATLSTLAVRNLAESLLAALDDSATVMIGGFGLAVVADTLLSAGHRVVAVDPSPAMLETLPGADGLTAHHSRFEALPLADHSVDAVVMIDALTQLGSDELAPVLSECHRVLREAGVLMASAPTTEPGADLLGHRLRESWSHVSSHRQLDVGGFAVLPGTTNSAAPTVVAGRPLTGSVRAVYLAANRRVDPPASLVHLAPGVPTALTAGMEELLTEHSTAAKRLADAQSVAHHLRDVQQRLVEAEQIASQARELEAALIDSRARIEELHGMIDTILRSTSWRLTEPVRRAGGVARSMTSKLALDTVRETVRKYRQG